MCKTESPSHADLAIEMNADVCAHVLRADLQHAVLVDPARVRPLGDDVVDDALAQVLRHRVLGRLGRFAGQRSRVVQYSAKR